MLAAGGSADADDRLSGANSGTATTSPKFFKICKGQTYALCAVASCFVFNEVAYCKCDVKSGDSITPEIADQRRQLRQGHTDSAGG